MDLHVVGPAATPDERAAIDAVLDPVIGPAASGWDGGARTEADGRIARGGHAARDNRHLLLPALQAAAARTGWLSRGALNHACRRLAVPPAEAYGVATFYALLPTTPRPPVLAHVCEDLACRLAGADRICDDLEAAAAAGTAPLGEGVGWQRSPCLGRCEAAPAMLVTIAGEVPAQVTVDRLGGAGDAGASGAGAVLAALARLAALADDGPSRVREELGATPAADLAAVRTLAPQAGEPGLRLLARVGRADPTSLEAYRAAGGYAGLARALALGPEATLAELTASGLVGRGGAAFPTGRKWSAVAAQPPGPRYVVANADESEPGTFKDRVLLEEDPFALVEACTIAGVTVGAEHGVVYLRGEYPLARERVAGAIARARAAGLLGPDVAGSGRAFELELRLGAGAYIAGEETALFESLEGRRPEPRNKPPFPVEAGLFGRPTVVNNVETLANVPLVLAMGGEAYARLGTSGSAGPKLFCVSGHVARPGVYEVEFGATLGDVLALAGGVAGGRDLQAVLLGGAAGVFVGPDSLALPLTLEGTRAAGATLGSGVIMAFDATADLAAALRRIAAFFRDESCGQCVPCRIGTVRQEELLARLATGRTLGTVADELARYAGLARVMRDASICGLGQTASSAIESALAAGLVHFGEEVRA